MPNSGAPSDRDWTRPGGGRPASGNVKIRVHDRDERAEENIVFDRDVLEAGDGATMPYFHTVPDQQDTLLPGDKVRRNGVDEIMTSSPIASLPSFRTTGWPRTSSPDRYVDAPRPHEPDRVASSTRCVRAHGRRRPTVAAGASIVTSAGGGYSVPRSHS